MRLRFTLLHVHKQFADVVPETCARDFCEPWGHRGCARRQSGHVSQFSEMVAGGSRTLRKYRKVNEHDVSLGQKFWYTESSVSI